MLRLTRVNLRRRLGPAKMDTIASMGLSPDVVDFMHNILGLCDGAAYKAMAVQAKATATELKPLKRDSLKPLLNSDPGVGPLPEKVGL